VGFEHTFHADHNVVVTAFRGAVKSAELLALYRGLYNDPRYVPGMNEVLDVRGADVKAVTTQDLREVAVIARKAYAESPRTVRTAVLYSSLVVAGLTRMYQVFAEANPEEVRAFDNADELAAWLGIPSDLIPPYDDASG
jgi:hypothetical protein